MAYRLLTCASLLLAAVALTLPDPSLAPRNDDYFVDVPVVNRDVEDPISHRYMVVYHTDAAPADIDAHQSAVIAAISRRNLHRRSPVTGQLLSTKVSTAQLGDLRYMTLEADNAMMAAIEQDATVNYIERDAIVRVSAFETVPPEKEPRSRLESRRTKVGRAPFQASKTQLFKETNAPTGLSRLSAASVNFVETRTYWFDQISGSGGVQAFVLDSGIRISHQDFGGRAVWGRNFVNDNDTDEYGHGTHVAGILGGTLYGVFKNVSLVAVKVFDANGTGAYSILIEGLQYVYNSVRSNSAFGKSVINMSFAGDRSPTLERAVDYITQAGIVTVVAAGNLGNVSDYFAPAVVRQTICVGAINQIDDTKPWWSNYGPGVDLFAPGVYVLSAGIGSDTDTKMLSGTSMATPHVAGLAAYLMALEGITNVTTLMNRIKALAQATGAKVQNNEPYTTSLIVNNGLRCNDPSRCVA